MPLVAIIGGLWALNDPDKADAEKIAREIGAALASAGLGLVVYFSDPASLEPYVVSGYVETHSAANMSPRAIPGQTTNSLNFSTLGRMIARRRWRWKNLSTMNSMWRSARRCGD
jgi:hypothetical protein